MISTSQTVGALGEHALVRAVIDRLGADHASRHVLLGPGDDAAVLTSDDPRVVVTTDVLVDGVHFRQAWSSGYDVGRKAAAQSLADVSAMGGVTTGVVVGLAAPPEQLVTWALELADGLREECDVVGAVVVGGDVVRSDRLTVSVTALGTLEGRGAVLRSGAQAGDVVAVAGALGLAEAGLGVLARGFRSPRVLVDAHRRPTPPYDRGPAAAAAGATAMCDVSDGLLQDLGHIARASGVAIDVETSAFEPPQSLVDAGAALNVPPMAWVLTGGEDHALAACFPSADVVPAGFVVCGRVTAGEPVVTVDGQEYDGPGGWDHFSG